MRSEGEGEERTEGYLYSFGTSRAGGIYCVLTFCVLSGRRFAQLRHKGDQVSLRSGVLDSNHRVEDNGRQLVNGKVLYTIRLFSTFDDAKEVLLGAPSAEEAAEWIKAFICALGKRPFSVWDPWPASVPLDMPSEETPLVPKNQQHKQITYRPLRPNRMSSLPESPESQPAPRWKLVRCENGLRYFEEICSGSKLPVMKAVGVVKGQADHIFDEIMNYGPERFQWDHTVETASIVKIIDGHSDIIHICLKQDWRWLRPRDFCITRYWKREENGSYTIFYRSVSEGPIEPGHVRATIHSGGYIVTPLVTSGKPKSLVESVFELDVGGWPSWVGTGLSNYSAHLRNNLLSVIAGIREFFAAQRVDSSISDLTRYRVVLPEFPPGPELYSPRASTPFLETDLDDFYDAQEDQLSEEGHDLNGSPKIAEEHNVGRALEKEFSLSKLNGSLAKGPLQHGGNSYADPDCNIFKIRGKDGSLVSAQDSYFKLVAVDWYKSKERLDHVSRHRGIVQKAPKDVFFFTFNLQVPHAGSYYSLIFYFATRRKFAKGSLIHRFVHGDDEFRSQRLVLSPSIPEGSWIVRQAVGSRAVVLGQILDCNFHKEANHIEVDVNMGSSGIVRGVMGIVFGYISALVVDMGFSLRAQSEDELPEEFIGAVRCSRLDLTAALVEPSLL